MKNLRRALSVFLFLVLAVTVPPKAHAFLLGPGGIIVNPTSGVAYEPEAATYFSATGLSDSAQKSAVNKLVIAIKAIGWSKFKAVYLMTGGTAALHKWNLIDPRDSDAAYRLNFVGSWTHNANGAVPTAAGAYADTFLKPADIGQNSIHLSYYTPNNQELSSTVTIMGGTYTSGSNVFYLSDMNSNGIYGGANGTETPMGASSFQSGLFLLNRTASNAWGITLPDGTLKSQTSASTTPSNTLNIYIGGLNFGPNPASTYPAIGVPCGLASVGTGLSSSDITSWRAAVSAFEPALGR